MAFGPSNLVMMMIGYQGIDVGTTGYPLDHLVGSPKERHDQS